MSPGGGSATTSAATQGNGSASLSDADADAQLTKALSLYDDDRLLDASSALDHVFSACTPGFRRKMEASPRVKRVRADMAEVNTIYSALGSKEGWVKYYESATTSVEYRQEPDKVSHTMRCSGEIHAPLRNVAAMLNEPDLFPAVFWFVQRSNIVGEKGRFKRAADLTLFAPPPLYNREVCLFGFAVDALDNHDSVLIVSRDRRTEDGLGDPSAPNRTSGKGLVRAVVHYSMFELRPVKPNVTKVRLIANSDPKLSCVPTVLINWGSRFIMRFSLRVLEARARNIDSLPHAARLGKPIYRYIDSRLVEYWAPKGYSEAEALAVDAVDNTENVSGEFDASARPAPPSGLSSYLPSLSTGFLPTGGLRRMLSRDR